MCSCLCFESGCMIISVLMQSTRTMHVLHLALSHVPSPTRCSLVVQPKKKKSAHGGTAERGRQSRHTASPRTNWSRPTSSCAERWRAREKESPSAPPRRGWAWLTDGPARAAQFGNSFFWVASSRTLPSQTHLRLRRSASQQQSLPSPAVFQPNRVIRPTPTSLRFARSRRRPGAELSTSPPPRAALAAPMEYDFRGSRSGSGPGPYGAPPGAAPGGGSSLYPRVGQPSHGGGGASTASPRAAPYHHGSGSGSSAPVVTPLAPISSSSSSSNSLPSPLGARNIRLIHGWLGLVPDGITARYVLESNVAWWIDCRLNWMGFFVCVCVAVRLADLFLVGVLIVGITMTMWKLAKPTFTLAKHLPLFIC
jgi:hypothetical protein